MGHNRSGDKRRARLKRQRRELNRLAGNTPQAEQQKPEKATMTKPVVSPAQKKK
jgi:hypothetical protein